MSVTLVKDSAGKTTSRTSCFTSSRSWLVYNYGISVSAFDGNVGQGDYAYASDGSATITQAYYDDYTETYAVSTDGTLTYKRVWDDKTYVLVYDFDETRPYQKLLKIYPESEGADSGVEFTWTGDTYTVTEQEYADDGSLAVEHTYYGYVDEYSETKDEISRKTYANGKVNYAASWYAEGAGANYMYSNTLGEGIIADMLYAYDTDGNLVQTSSATQGTSQGSVTTVLADGSTATVRFTFDGFDYDDYTADIYVTSVTFAKDGKTYERCFTNDENTLVKSKENGYFTVYENTLPDGLVVRFRQGGVIVGLDETITYTDQYLVSIPYSYYAAVGSGPVIVAGANAVTDGSSDLVVTSNADFSGFEAVLVDGAVVDPSNYTAESGSTKVTLKAAYLKTLSAGGHTVAIQSTDGTAETTITVGAANKTMYRLYNPWSGEHFYTADAVERAATIAAGWNDEGIGWTAPSMSSTPVYRLYSGTDHHYTKDAVERDYLISVGWKDEGIGWYSDDAQGVALLRQYNPYVDPNAATNNSGSHNYTTNQTENDALVAAGWKAEGVAWYGMKTD